MTPVSVSEKSGSDQAIPCDQALQIARLDAEKAYRDTRLAYLNLIGSYLTAGAQMNMAVGRELL